MRVEAVRSRGRRGGRARWARRPRGWAKDGGAARGSHSESCGHSCAAAGAVWSAVRGGESDEEGAGRGQAASNSSLSSSETASLPAPTSHGAARLAAQASCRRDPPARAPGPARVLGHGPQPRRREPSSSSSSPSSRPRVPTRQLTLSPARPDRCGPRPPLFSTAADPERAPSARAQAGPHPHPLQRCVRPSLAQPPSRAPSADLSFAPAASVWSLLRQREDEAMYQEQQQQ